MDHFEGAQIPQGILPGVTVLKPGLALCLRHSQVDKRYVESHIEQLSQHLPGELYPAFIALDTSTGNIEHVMETLGRRREEALRNNRVFFLYSPFFAPRLPRLMEFVEHLFYYGPGLSAPLLLAEKINGHRLEDDEREALILKRTPRRTEERKMLSIQLPSGVSAEEATHLIGEVLASKFSGQIDIATVNKNEQ